MIREQAELFDMGCGAIHWILTEILQMMKIYNSELYIILILRACCKWNHINIFTNVGQRQFNPALVIVIDTLKVYSIARKVVKSLGIWCQVHAAETS